MATSPARSRQINTLAIDIGGTGLKASVLDLTGHMECERVRVDTPYPLSPQKLVLELQKMIEELPPFDRVSVGFPGMVRNGQILSAPHFVSPLGPGGRPDAKLVNAWSRFDLAAALAELTGKPTKVANDADMQGAAVVEGSGFEAVLTLGTGVGTAFFLEGQLLPHFEFAHHPFRKGASYNEAIGEAARKRIGHKKWHKRVIEAIETIRELTFFDVCYVGGGNSPRLGGDLPAGVKVVDNSAGILGGIKLWERSGPLAGSAPRRDPAKKAPARKASTATKKTTATPRPAAKSAASKSPATKSPASKSPATKSPASKSPATTAPPPVIEAPPAAGPAPFAPADAPATVASPPPMPTEAPANTP